MLYGSSLFLAYDGVCYGRFNEYGGAGPHGAANWLQEPYASKISLKSGRLDRSGGAG
jgi:hypothetical protein